MWLSSLGFIINVPRRFIQFCVMLAFGGLFVFAVFIESVQARVAPCFGNVLRSIASKSKNLTQKTLAHSWKKIKEPIAMKDRVVQATQRISERTWLRKKFSQTHIRFLMTKTEEGRLLLSELTGLKNASETLFQRHAETIFAYRRFMADPVRVAKDKKLLAEVLARLTAADDGMRMARLKIGRKVDSKILSVSEQQLMREYASSFLKGDELVMQSETVNASIQMQKPDRFLQVKETPEEFFSRRLFSPLKEAPAEVSAKNMQAVTEWQTYNFVKELKACIRSMPEKEKAKAATSAIIKQIGLNEAITLWGYFSANGKIQLDSDLAIQMGATLASGIVEPWLSLGNGSVLKRYAQMTAFGSARGSLEALAFYLNPKSNDYEGHKKEAAIARTEAAAGWSGFSTGIKMPLNQFFMGMECLFPGVWWAQVGAGALQVSYKMSSSSGYFIVRKKSESLNGVKPSEEKKKK